MQNYIDPRYAPKYDPEAVQYMRDELIEVGFEEALTLEDIDRHLIENSDETVLFVINSVCGCSAGTARPGIAMALQHHCIPDRLVTSFAGQDRMAVEYLRQRFLSNYMPSSPCIALFRGGELLYFLQRKDIVDREATEIARMLIGSFEKYCHRRGPSMEPEKFEQLTFVRKCSSELPKYSEN